MKGYNAPTFQDRAAASLKARQKALAALMTAPRPDAATLADRAARHAKRDALAKAKSEKARAAREERQRLADARRAAATEAKVKVERPAKTEEERKAARDARYAARKSRK